MVHSEAHVLLYGTNPLRQKLDCKSSLIDMLSVARCSFFFFLKKCQSLQMLMEVDTNPPALHGGCFCCLFF